MTEQTKREQVIEKIAKKLAPVNFNLQYDQLTDSEQGRCLLEADVYLGIFESLGYVRKAQDQSLPENPHNEAFYKHLDNSDLTYGGQKGYDEAQQDMLTPDKNGCVWVKVEE